MPSLREARFAWFTPGRVLLIAAAAVGAALLLTVAVTRWTGLQDEHAYWLAARRTLDGLALYDPSATPVTPYAYWYPPIVAQALAPAAAVLPAAAFSAAWTALLVGCLIYLGGGRPLVALALVAFVPVAVELWFRNVHLLLAAILVLALRRWPWLFAIGAAIKVAPGLGIVYLAARGRWRDAAVASAVGLGVLVASAAIAPDAWRQFLAIVAARGPDEIASFVPVPYAVRASAAVALAVVAGRLAPRLGDPLLVVAVVVGSPTLWVNALSMLVAIVPIVRWHRARDAAAASSDSPAGDEPLPTSA